MRFGYKQSDSIVYTFTWLINIIIFSHKKSVSIAYTLLLPIGLISFG